ncbi:MAG: ATP-binding protein [Bacteroidota bacterium]
METEKVLKILLLEDNPADAFLIKRVLTRDNLKFITELVDGRNEFCEAIARFQPDVILSDHGLPMFNSRDALKIALKERPMSPFILVTGTMSDEIALGCLKNGADDYVLKDNLSRLPLVIRRALKERRLEKLKREARYALRKQNAELTKVNQELDNFVYSVSHNLRGPLASVLGLLNIARTEDVNSRVVSLHSMMESSINRLDETLKDILAYSNNTHGDMHSKVIQWEEKCKATFNLLSYLPGFDSVRISVSSSSTGKPFHSDPVRIALIFRTLFTNAIQYLDAKKDPMIHVDVVESDGLATIQVKDNGIGIDAEYLPAVFDMFYRATEKSLGAGLGLYIAKETVKKLNGSISIRSTVGEETVVTIVLPDNSQFTNETGSSLFI